MGGPVLFDALLAAVLVVTTGSCVVHVARHRGPLDLGAVETTMGVVMIAMLLGAPFGDGVRLVTVAAFAVAAPWCAYRAWRPAVTSVPSPLVTVGATAQQAVLCSAMVLVLAAGPMAAMSGRSATVMAAMSGATTSGSAAVQVLAVVVGIALVVGAGHDGYRLLVARRAASHGTGWAVVCRVAMVAASGWMLLPLLG